MDSMGLFSKCDTCEASRGQRQVVGARKPPEVVQQQGEQRAHPVMPTCTK